MSDMTPDEAARIVDHAPWAVGTSRECKALNVLINHARASDGTWFPKVLVVTDESWHRGRRGSSVEWGRADIVVTPDGTVLKNKYGPTGWTDWRS